jgi:short-subunit dehydrogenase
LGKLDSTDYPCNSLAARDSVGTRFEESIMEVADEVVVITGASSGIGRALAFALARHQAKVGLIARRQEALETLCHDIRASGGQCATARADVSIREEVVPAIRQLAQQLGPVGLLIANAGVGMPTVLDPMNVPDIETMFKVNVLGVVYSIEAVLSQMLAQRRGCLAAVSSLAAYKGMPGESAYCASKAAVSTYMEGLRIHLRDKGIQVTTVCPGFVRTPMVAANDFHMPFLLEADRAAELIIRALVRGKKVYNFPWQTGLLMRAVRWLPDWALARTMRKYNENPPFVTAPDPQEVRRD